MASKDDYARAIIQEGQRRGITPKGIKIALATALVESNLIMYANQGDPESLNFPHEALSRDANSVGLFQQRAPWWGTVADRMDPARSAGLFYAALVKRDYNSDAHSPGWYAQNVQQSAFPDRYDQRFGEASALYDRLVGSAQGGPQVGWTGDPVWLEDVLREALGDRLKVMDGWKDRGTGGQMGDIWGVMIHHTGNRNETPERIRDGRPDLAGPLSQGLIKPDGTFWLVAVGPCNHAGVGSYPGIPTDDGNDVLIGFECAWPTINPDGSYDPNERWPDAQIITMRDATTAVLKKLGYGADRVIRHQDYAGARQGKWDAGNLSTKWFRGEVEKDLRGEFDRPVEQPPAVPPVVPPPILPPPANPRDDRTLLVETWDQLRGPGGKGWDMLGGKTIVESLADLHRKVDQLIEKDVA